MFLHPIHVHPVGLNLYTCIHQVVKPSDSVTDSHDIGYVIAR